MRVREKVKPDREIYKILGIPPPPGKLNEKQACFAPFAKFGWSDAEVRRLDTWNSIYLYALTAADGAWRDEASRGADADADRRDAARRGGGEPART